VQQSILTKYHFLDSIASPQATTNLNGRLSISVKVHKFTTQYVTIVSRGAFYLCVTLVGYDLLEPIPVITATKIQKILGGNIR
jgi:hypothetical protein